jgi:hypothetical protein
MATKFIVALRTLAISGVQIHLVRVAPHAHIGFDAVLVLYLPLTVSFEVLPFPDVAF